MHIEFSAERPGATSTIALPVEKDGLDRLDLAGFDAVAQAIIRAAAKAARFDGEAAASAEAMTVTADAPLHVFLVGVGSGSDAEYERAGGALAARFLTSGVKAVAVDFGALGGAPAPLAAARFAAGAAQRAWRLDVYRTKLAERAKPTL